MGCLRVPGAVYVLIDSNDGMLVSLRTLAENYESRGADRAFVKVCLPCTAAKGYRDTYTPDAAKQT